MKITIYQSLSLSLSDLLAKSGLDAPNHAKASKIYKQLNEIDGNLGLD